MHTKNSLVCISSQSVPNIASPTVTGKVSFCVFDLIPNPIGSLFPVRMLLKTNKELALIYFPSTAQDPKPAGSCTEELTELYLLKRDRPPYRVCICPFIKTLATFGMSEQRWWMRADHRGIHTIRLEIFSGQNCWISSVHSGLSTLFLVWIFMHAF